MIQSLFWNPKLDNSPNGKVVTNESTVYDKIERKKAERTRNENYLSSIYQKIIEKDKEERMRNENFLYNIVERTNGITGNTKGEDFLERAERMRNENNTLSNMVERERAERTRHENTRSGVVLSNINENLNRITGIVRDRTKDEDFLERARNTIAINSLYDDIEDEDFTITTTKPKEDSIEDQLKKMNVIPSPEDSPQEVLCMVCMENKRNVLFLDCSHMVCCPKCTIDMISKNGFKCPACRSVPSKVIQVFIP